MNCEDLNTLSKIDTFLVATKKYNWFYNFIIILLNDKCFDLIKDKDHKILNYIKNNNLDDIEIEYEFINIIKSLYLHQNDINIYTYLLSNNYINYILLPLFIKYLGFSCLSLEYYNKKLYGGIANYLKKEVNGKKISYKINKNKMISSRGIQYDMRSDRVPEFLIINMWENDKLLESDLDDANTLDALFGESPISFKLDENNVPKKELEYNGYKYKLKSYLLTNYNTKEFKSPEHTIGFTKCNNKDTYALANYYYTPQDKQFYIKSLLNPLKKQEKSCNKLFKIDYPDKKISLDNNSCNLLNGVKIKEADEKIKYCFSIKKGKRVFIYIKDERIITEEEKAAAKKKAEEEKAEKTEKTGKDDATKGPKQQETPEQKKKREENEKEKEKVCNVITEYLNKIKIETTNKKDKDFIMTKMKELEDKEKSYQSRKDELIKLRRDIEDTNKKAIETMNAVLENFKKDK